MTHMRGKGQRNTWIQSKCTKKKLYLDIMIVCVCSPYNALNNSSIVMIEQERLRSPTSWDTRASLSLQMCGHPHLMVGVTPGARTLALRLQIWAHLKNYFILNKKC